MYSPVQGTLRSIASLFLALVVAIPSSATAQSRADRAIRFYAEGGAYCFRVVPLGVAPSKETQWTMMVLTSKSNRKNTFKLRDVDPGKTGLSGFALGAVGMEINGVLTLESERREFFERFAHGINEGVLRARVVKVGPTHLAQMPSDSDRAELYTKLFKIGSSISFDNVPDLKAEEFALYSSYFAM